MLSDFITIMQNHIGRDLAITGEDLARKLGTNTRQLRHLTDVAIDEGISLCSHPAHGYWIALDVKELEFTCEYHRSRALHELAKEAKLRKIGLADLLGQMHLKT